MAVIDANPVPTLAVGTTRNYLLIINENFLDSWDKIKHNDFVNMIYPIEEVANGNSMAGVVALIPGEAPVSRTASIAANTLERALATPVKGKIVKVLSTEPTVFRNQPFMGYRVLMDDGTERVVTGNTLFKNNIIPEVENLVTKKGVKIPVLKSTRPAQEGLDFIVNEDGSITRLFHSNPAYEVPSTILQAPPKIIDALKAKELWDLLMIYLNKLLKALKNPGIRETKDGKLISREAVAENWLKPIREKLNEVNLKLKSLIDHGFDFTGKPVKGIQPNSTEGRELKHLIYPIDESKQAVVEYPYKVIYRGRPELRVLFGAPHTEFYKSGGILNYLNYIK